MWCRAKIQVGVFESTVFFKLINGSEGWEEAVHMPSCVTYVTKEHFMFVKRTLTYMAVSINRGRGEQGSGRERGRGRYRGSG